jgi:hypothetical protein
MEGFYSCPECGYENPQGSTTCKRCLLVFEKYERKNTKVHNVVNASANLENLWRDLLTDYENTEKHEKFITQALADKNLAFASQQYRKMLELNNLDEISKKMIDKIIQVATLTYMPPPREHKQVETNHRGLKVFLFLIFIALFGLIGRFFIRH